MFRSKSKTSPRIAPWLASIILFLGAPVALANPPTANLANWNSICYNCYNYACNLMTALFAQPGNGGGAPINGAITVANVTAGAKADGLTPLNAATAAQALQLLPANTCLVYMAVSPGTPAFPNDYHWYRYNADGTWSDKPGGTPAKIFENNNVNVADPSTANRGPYTTAGGFFAVPMNNPPPPTLGELPGFACPPAGAGAAGGQENIENDEDNLPQLNNSEVNEALTVVPQPGDPTVTNPEWPDFSDTIDPADGQYDGGFFLEPDASDSAFSGAYYEVYDGVVAVYSDMNGDNVTYYDDTHGLESFLESTVPEPGSASLVILGASVLLGKRRRSAA